MIYIVKDGEFQINRKRVVPPQIENIEKEQNKNFIGPGDVKDKIAKKNKANLDATKKPLVSNIRLTQLCSGQMFGEEDAINDRQYTTSVTCISGNATVYCIKTEEFIQKFRQNESTWKLIEERIDDKDTETIMKIRQFM